ncbi:MAG: hypothetical protein JWO36_5364 [Myxococcales bacterium]|nr:hypothetical protein [Myxococcales bacterium]
MRAVALTLSIALLSGCFPHDAHKRTLAQLGEGGSILAGVAIEAVINSGADCDQMGPVASPDSSCRNKAAIFGDVGLGLILAGLVGFLATISTAEDEKVAPAIDIKADAKTEDKTPLKLPPGVKGNAVATPAN